MDVEADMWQFLQERLKLSCIMTIINDKMFEAIINKDLSKLKDCISYFGADVHATNSQNLTPIVVAVWISNSKDIIQYLINMGADVDDLLKQIHNPTGAKPDDDTFGFLETKLIPAFFSVLSEEGDVNIQIPNLQDKFSKQIADGNFQNVTMYIDYFGANTNERDSNQQTPIQVAVLNNTEPELAQYLLMFEDIDLKGKLQSIMHNTKFKTS